MPAEKTEPTTAIEREVRIAAEPEIVYELLTKPEMMQRWMGQSAELDAQPGGVFRCQVGERYTARGEYLDAVPNGRVAFTWGWEGDEDHLPPGGSTVEIELLRDAGGTLLRFTHRGLPEGKSAAGHDSGWDHYLERLRAVAEGRDPGPDTFPDRV
jgi:uncharacterized protein YndB with AHSA1/START domain